MFPNMFPKTYFNSECEYAKRGCVQVSVSAMLVYTRQKKISFKFLFLSDIFLFPFVRQ